MSELVGRFLSFEEHLGRELVKFVYYVLLFLLIVTTLYELVTALYALFAVKFWPNLWQFLVVIPLRFFVALLLLRVGAELVIAVLAIDDNIRGDLGSGDTMSTGLNPVAAPKAAPTMKTAAQEPANDEDVASDPAPAKAPATTKKSTGTTKKAAARAAPTRTFEPDETTKKDSDEPSSKD